MRTFKHLALLGVALTAIVHAETTARADDDARIHGDLGSPPIRNSLNLASPSQKGSLLVIPRIELRFDGPEPGTANLLQDTFITLTNDMYQDVLVYLFFLNGTTGYQIDSYVHLTARNPCYWSAYTGCPGPLGNCICPFHLVGPPEEDPAAPGEYVIRGYMVAFAVDLDFVPICWNHLKAGATIVDYVRGGAWHYDGYAFQVHSVDPGEQLPETGVLHLDGSDYDLAPGELLFDFFAVGATLESGGGANLTLSDGDLTLLSMDQDLTLGGTGPAPTQADLVIWNENELVFTGTRYCTSGWDQSLLSSIGGAFLVGNLQTTRGRARIDGVASPECPGSYDVPLLGVATRAIDPGAGTRPAGLPLVGDGAQAAAISYDVFEPPPEVAGKSPGSASRNKQAGPPARRGERATDRTTASRAGSLLVFPLADLRFDGPDPATANVVQDVFINVSNDCAAPVRAQLYYVSETGNVHTEYFELTGEQPVYWSLATGLPAGVAPFTEVGPPSTDPNAGPEFFLRGYVLVWAVNSLEQEIHWNHLTGDAMLVNYTTNASWTYHPYAFRALEQGGTVQEGDQTGTPHELNLDGVEFDQCHEWLLLDFFASGATAFSGGGRTVNHETDLTMLVADMVLELSGLPPTETQAVFELSNENEVVFTGARGCVTQWDESLLSAIDPRFSVYWLSTNKGHARIDGKQSAECPGSGWAPLLGVQVQMLDFEGLASARAGSALAGAGVQGAVIAYDADCNGNGVSDAEDIAGGTSLDCNLNGVPDECEFDFSTLYVDGAYSGCENGTEDYPFNTVGEANDFAVDGTTIVIQAGDYYEMLTFSKELRLESRNGLARIAGE